MNTNKRYSPQRLVHMEKSTFMANSAVTCRLGYDGISFQNREGRLPGAARGYYREFTVTTPGSRDRGARRIISGGQPPVVFYYSDDHYRSFRRIRE